VTLRVVGAGLGRTGTHSLKLAFERLLGAPCYHRLEVLAHPEHVAAWRHAIDGDAPRWDELLAGYRAAVDWPVAAFWDELSVAYPDAIVVLSVRDADSWWSSASRTIFDVQRREPPPDPTLQAFSSMVTALLTRRFTPHWSDADAAIAAYERHNEQVRATVAPERLLEWRAGDGWAPLCAALDLGVPDEPFPHVNTTSEFRALAGLDAEP
jgi:hypothetical protein